MEWNTKQLGQYLPNQFDFYHLGEVERCEQGDELFLDDLSSVAYKINGDVNGLMITLVPQGLDLSVYSELGNILASRLATALTEKLGLDVMISSPSLLKVEELQRLLERNYQRITSTYQHRYQGTSVRVEVLILIVPEERRGNA
jgi:hypothetical protein